MAEISRQKWLHGCVKQYVGDVFAPKLIEDGFVCPDGEMLSWYRIKNHEIINSIRFFMPWSGQPWDVIIGYGIHPIFFKPIYIKPVVLRDVGPSLETFFHQPLWEKENLNNLAHRIYSPDAPLSIPIGEGKGIYTYNELIRPKMERAVSVETCYQVHKEQINLSKANIPNIKFSCLFSPYFVAEAIYVEDTSMYPYCIESTLTSIDSRLETAKNYPQLRVNEDFLPELMLQKNALLDGKRKEYLDYLEQKKEENIAYIRKKIGLIV